MPIQFPKLVYTTAQNYKKEMLVKLEITDNDQSTIKKAKNMSDCKPVFEANKACASRSWFEAIADTKDSGSFLILA